MKNSKGITLIALVITIIVLIILAGVAINLTLGENGILSKAETAKLKYEISKAEEELDIKIVDLQAEKQGTATLQDLVDVLKNEEDMDYIVSLEEIASITGVETIGDVDEIYVVYKIYQFRVDDKLQTEFISIVESYTADVAISSTLKSHDGKNEDEKYLATYEIKVESQGQVQSIEIETVDGKITEVPTSLPYTKEIQVEIGQKYIVKVTTPDGKYKRYVIEEKAEETIKTAQELATFRDKVNSGLTYEGKTLKLEENIDLAGQEWMPIGTETNPFKATFDGGYNSISNQNASLFSMNEGTIKNVIIKNANIENSSNITGILTENNNGTINNCGIEEGSITVQTTDYLILAGITGLNCGEIRNSYNKATITGSITSGDYVRIGGIVGQSWTNSSTENCYNTGEINGTSTIRVQLGGISGSLYYNNSIISNCYNIGNVIGDAPSLENIGGVVGTNGESYTFPGGTITNCYTNPTTTYSYYYNSGNSMYTSTTGRLSDTTTLKGYASTLGDAYIADGKIKDKNGEWIDNVDSDGNIIYINGGYPILKWQMGE